ncbi:hypothetical protein LCGC14_0146110 [marine sediment metagenome]|uniref:Uncharacterized protein n=1 Tax=marine sediment metagenome TaxID=412755 RepID=A0A0F9UZW2_9ZZZZ
MKLKIENNELILGDVFNAIGIETDQGTFGVAQRDGGIEIVLNGETVFVSSDNVKDTLIGMPQEIVDAVEGIFDNSIDPCRPFTGQPQTMLGERGSTFIKPDSVRIRDLADCIVKAFIRAAVEDLPSKLEIERLRKALDANTLNYNDLYLLDLSKMDPIALIQNTCVEIEKVMGTYPNIPEAKVIGDSV